MTGANNKRTAAKAAMRERVIRAARVVFLREGYVAATMRGIAKEAGVSTGAIFANFVSKDELWTAVTGFQTPDQWSKDVLKTVTQPEEAA